MARLTITEKRNRDRRILYNKLRKLGFTPKQATNLKNSPKRLKFLREAARKRLPKRRTRPLVTASQERRDLTLGTFRSDIAKEKQTPEERQTDWIAMSRSDGPEVPQHLDDSVEAVKKALKDRGLNPDKVDDFAWGIVHDWYVLDAFDLESEDLAGLIEYFDEYDPFR